MEYETKKKSPPLPDVKPIKSKVIGKISSSSMGEMLFIIKSCLYNNMCLSMFDNS